MTPTEVSPFIPGPGPGVDWYLQGRLLGPSCPGDGCRSLRVMVEGGDAYDPARLEPGWSYVEPDGSWRAEVVGPRSHGPPRPPGVLVLGPCPPGQAGTETALLEGQLVTDGDFVGGGPSGASEGWVELERRPDFQYGLLGMSP